MRRNHSFIRKVIYIAIIALLLIPLSYLSQPATTSGKVVAREETGDDAEKRKDADQQSERRGRSGGKLAQLRQEYKLSQSNLGEIDPASETMKLATLGMKGIAVNMLWHQANEYKKKKMWDKLAVTVRQITKLQPNFETVWEFQAHNLAYNVSVQFDNYEHRYHWVKKGLNFLMEGTEFNSSAHRLFWYTGWVVGQKIGRSDEYKEFRQLFKEETDYRITLMNYVLDRVDKLPLVLRGEFDNWIMAYLWFSKAQDLAANNRGKPLKMSKPVFFQSKAKALISYAKAISEEVRPELNGITQRAWQIAADEWRQFGDFEIRTPWDTVVALNRLESAELRVEELRNRLDTEIAPGVREEIETEKRADLRRGNPEYLFAYDERELSDDPDSLPDDVIHMANEAGALLGVSDTEVAARAPKDKEQIARDLLAKIHRAAAYAENIRQYRGHVNFAYWKLRCEAESEDDAILARQAIFDARQLENELKYTRVEKLDEDGNLIPQLDENGQVVLDKQGDPVYVMVDGARQKFEKAWDHWHKLFFRADKKYETLTADVDTDELMTPIKEYRSLLHSLGEEELPVDFKLLPLITAERSQKYNLPTPDEIRAAHAKVPEKTEQKETAEPSDAKAGSS